MKSYLSLVAVASLAFAGAVQAHAHLEKSVPAANSTLASAPKSVELAFNEAVQITALTLQTGDAKPQGHRALAKGGIQQDCRPSPGAGCGQLYA